MDRTAPSVRTPDRDELRALVERGNAPGRVLSVYLDLDPTRFGTPPARQSQITSVIDDARRRADDPSLPHEMRESLRRDLDRVRVYCETTPPMNGTHGLAVFCSEPAELFDVLPLPHRVDPGVVIDDSPYIEPLAEYASTDRWGVALINRSSFRLFEGGEDGLQELRAIHDDVHRRHSQGGWSQARYERSVGQDVANHLGRVASDLFLFHESRPFDHILVGTLNELWPEVQRGLHPYLRERIRARIDIDVEHSTLDEVCDAVRPAIGEHVRKRERALRDQLAQELGRGGRATAGLTETLRALDDRRVATLLLRAGARGTERALHLAIAQSADIVVVRHHDELARHDGVAALLRF